MSDIAAVLFLLMRTLRADSVAVLFKKVSLQTKVTKATF